MVLGVPGVRLEIRGKLKQATSLIQDRVLTVVQPDLVSCIKIMDSDATTVDYVAST